MLHADETFAHADTTSSTTSPTSSPTVSPTTSPPPVPTSKAWVAGPLVGCIAGAAIVLATAWTCIRVRRRKGGLRRGAELHGISAPAHDAKELSDDAAKYELQGSARPVAELPGFVPQEYDPSYVAELEAQQAYMVQVQPSAGTQLEEQGSQWQKAEIYPSAEPQWIWVPVDGEIHQYHTPQQWEQVGTPAQQDQDQGGHAAARQQSQQGYMGHPDPHESHVD
jgi:hypothetical protein